MGATLISPWDNEEDEDMEEDTQHIHYSKDPFYAGLKDFSSGETLQTE